MVDEVGRMPGYVGGGAGSNDARIADAGIHVVGVGASAGGVAALKGLCAALPPDIDVALVVILHLDPRADSALPELLAAQTPLPVRFAQDGMPIEAGHIYVCPPGSDLTIANGHLAVRPQGPARIRLPVDHFLRSLAVACRERAAAVILSGTGADGSQGVRAVRGEGGLTIAQDLAEAEHDSMPRSAIATGVVDLVLPVRAIPAALADYGSRRLPSAAEETLPASAEGLLAPIIALLKEAKAHDFSPYKPAMLMRRIAHRMALNKREELSDYLDLLRKDPREVDALFKDDLVNVTEFFRDRDHFAYLEREIVPDILKRHADDTPIRAWVPACSTGEEAYSVAILLIEALAAAERPIRLQVFATDVNPDALETVRRGTYPDSIADNVSAERLERFFTHSDRGYTVRTFLRECVIVSAQNVLADAPFSNLDLISCRNLLIYLKPDVQDAMLRLLHFGLRPGGVLFLGSSENVRNELVRFERVSASHRVFRRVGQLSPMDAQPPLRAGATPSAHTQWPRAHGHRRTTGLAATGQRLILEKYAPPSVIVDRRYSALYHFGPVDRYLRVPRGEASHDIISMAREGLRGRLRDVLDEALAGDGYGFVEGAIFERDGNSAMVNITVIPVPDDEDRIFLVTFQEVTPSATGVTGEALTPAESDRLAELERELEATRSELRSMISDLETSNEELKAANEEAMSINEEFQSANEELETSKEELQSVNEELIAVNVQLEKQVDAQRKSADDLANLLASADIATLFLDREMRIRYFTPAVRRIFPIVDADIGRLLSDFVPQLDDPTLLDDAAGVLEALVPAALEVETRSGDWYSRRILPYRTNDDRIEGVVIAYVEVSALKRAEQEALASQHYAEDIVDAVRHPLLVLDADLRVVTAARSFCRMFGVPTEKVEGHHVRNIGDGQSGRPSASRRAGKGRARAPRTGGCGSRAGGPG